MFRTALVLAALSMSGFAPAVASAAAPTAEMPDGFLHGSVKLEILAFRTLLQANHKAVRSSGEAMSEAAMQSHAASAELAGQARILSARGDNDDAYRKLRDAWDARAAANAEFLERAEPAVVREVAGRYLEVVDARLEELQANGAPPIDPAAIEGARQLRDEGRQAAAKGEHALGLDLSVQALDRLDRAILAAFGDGEA